MAFLPGCNPRWVDGAWVDGACADGPRALPQCGAVAAASRKAAIPTVVNHRMTPKAPAQQGLLLASHSNP